MSNMRSFKSGPRIVPYLEFSIGQPLHNFRTVPIGLGKDHPKAFLSFYSANYDIDADYEMFCYPTDTFKMMVYTETGEIIWKRDLGPGIVPGTAFSTFFAFDMDQDDIDEIWFVNNLDPIHPLNYKKYCLERVNPLTGETTGQWPWPEFELDQSMSHFFRCHIFGGYVHSEPVLVTVQGTYGLMNFQAWRPDMTFRWTKSIAKDEPGARGSHNYPVLDINNDGIDEFLWGERCLSFHDGSELFCADRDTWHGHSDMIQPIWDYETNRWSIYVFRETHPNQAPRIIRYDDRGNPIWSAVDQGHIHKGWAGRIGLNGEFIATAVRIEAQTKTLEGRYYSGTTEFAFDLATGDPVHLPFSINDSAPIDINGDAFHEIVRGISSGNAEVIHRDGSVIQKIGGRLSICSKIVSHPGEHLMAYYPDGMVRIWVDANAQDSPLAQRRYSHPFYKANQRFPSKESIMCVLAGI